MKSKGNAIAEPIRGNFPPQPRERLLGPDVLRFVAASLVLIRHWCISFENNQTFINYFWRVAGGAPLGVDIFFVLSGFLVSGLLFQEFKTTGSFSITRFLIRRCFKIYPAYWALFLVTLLLQEWLGAKPPAIDLWAMAFFFQNYLPLISGHGIPPDWGPTWSLAVEEHFYLLLAVLFWILKKLGQRSGLIRLSIIPSVFFYTALACFVLRFLTSQLIPYYDDDSCRLPSHLRMDSLFFGVLLAYFWHLRWTDRTKATLRKCWPIFLALGLGLLLPNFIWHIDSRLTTFAFADIQFYLGAGCLLVASLAMNGSKPSPFVRALAWLGKHSYSVYLWHMAILAYLVLPIQAWNLVPAVPGLYFLVYFAASWLIGTLLAKCVEFPALAVRDRLFPTFAKYK